MARPVTVKIGGVTHDIDLDDALHIHDADAERHTTAADMAWWGIIAAAAQSRVDKLTAAAASWHAAALVTCLKADDKMSEWKAKANATGHSEYLKMQNDIADAQEMASRASTVHWAFARKMQMLEAMLPSYNRDASAARDIGKTPEARANDPRLNAYKQRHGSNAKQTSKED